MGVMVEAIWRIVRKNVFHIQPAELLGLGPLRIVFGEI
jgi:hypothetical protein